MENGKASKRKIKEMIKKAYIYLTDRMEREGFWMDFIPLPLSLMIMFGLYKFFMCSN